MPKKRHTSALHDAVAHKLAAGVAQRVEYGGIGSIRHHQELHHRFIEKYHNHMKSCCAGPHAEGWLTQEFQLFVGVAVNPLRQQRIPHIAPSGTT
jgi:hypothetical protein